LDGGFALFKVRVDRQQCIRPEVAVRILRINGRLQIRGTDLAERARKAGLAFDQRAVEIERLHNVSPQTIGTVFNLFQSYCNGLRLATVTLLRPLDAAFAVVLTFCADLHGDTAFYRLDVADDADVASLGLQG